MKRKSLSYVQRRALAALRSAALAQYVAREGLDKCGCGCDGNPPQVHFRANLSTTSRRETLRGRAHIVIPVVMLRETVVNGGFVPASELHPFAWNGVPVTLRHPEQNGNSITANDPKTLEQFAIGTIFNTTLEGDKLKAEAWVDIELARAAMPGLIEKLEMGVPMDVSTGYYPTVTKRSGVYNGKDYVEVHSELKPDHLALLPDEIGACSFEDGCGVRANERGTKMTKTIMPAALAALLGKAPKAGTPAPRVNAEDAREIVAELIADEGTPFEGADMDALLYMRPEALEAIAAEFLGGNGGSSEGEEGDEEEDPAANEDDEDDEDDEDEKPKANGKSKAPGKSQKVGQMTAADLSRMVANAAAEAATKAVKAAMETGKRSALVAEIVANKTLGLSKADLEGVPLRTLSRIALKAKMPAAPAATTTAPGVRANYGARPAPTAPETGGAVTRFPAMANLAKAEEKKG